MTLNPITLFKRLRRIFYDGPKLFNYPGRRIEGYRSPNYMIYQWLLAFGTTRFTLLGLLLFLLSGVISMVGATSDLMPVYLLSIGMGAIFLVDFVVGWWIRPHLSVRRVVPESAPVNSQVRIDYTLVNPTPRPAWQVYLDATPLPRGISRPVGTAYVESLDANTSATLTTYIQAERRGEYLLPLPVADSAFPFGLWRWGTYGTPNRPVVIYPEYTPLVKLPIPIGARYQSGMTKVDAHTGDAAEFHGCREYRYGDNPRHIHALSWARHQEPIIKEFREEYLTRVAVLVDTYPRPVPKWMRLVRPDNPNFEGALSLSAAVVDFLVRADYQVDFFALGKPPLRGGGGRGASYLQTILNLMAGMKPSVDEWPGIPEDLVMEMSQISAAIVVLLKWDEDREQLVTDLRQAGITTRVIVVSDVALDLPMDPNLVAVTPDQVLSGQVTEL